jgi:hypothetical protein
MTELNGKIYKITSPSTDKIYIGSTIKSLQQRMAKHYSDYDSGLYSSKYILDFKDAEIELIEEFKCFSRAELYKREGELIKQYKNICINKRIAGRKQKEYIEENKDKIYERGKIYREGNKDKIAERDKIYRDKNKDKIDEKKKRYRDNHRAELNEKGKNYYEKNKNKILERIKEKIKCDCGLEVSKNHLKRHLGAGLHKRILSIAIQ